MQGVHTLLRRQQPFLNEAAMAKTVCAYCASSPDVDCRYLDAAYRLGAALARAGATAVCGAGSQGLMRNFADGCIDNGGTAIGVIPQFMADKGWGYDALTETIVTPDIHTRKQRMAEMADAVVALPGGCGTLEELLEIITWKQLGLFHGKIIIANIAGFFTPLLQMLQRCVDEGFMRPSHITLWTVAKNPEEAAEKALTADTSIVEPKRP